MDDSQDNQVAPPDLQPEAAVPGGVAWESCTPFEVDVRQLRQVCDKHDVTRLQVFGSIGKPSFDPEHSDVDLLVEFRPEAERTFAAFFALRDDLTRILGREVDLVDARTLRNPYHAASIRRGARDLYAA